MTLTIDFEQPVFSSEITDRLTTTDLDDFYINSAEIDKLNLYFCLLASAHHYQSEANFPKAAKLYFLIAYYLFVPLTPPGSEELALYYINKAISLNPLPEYKEWLSIIEKGN